MKRIIFVLAISIAINSTAFAQLFGSSPVQTAADVTRAYLWDKPVTDSITYRGILPGSMRVVTMFGANATPYIVLFDSIQFVKAQNYFSDSFMRSNMGRIVGYEYVVMYIGKFSWMKKKDLKKLRGMQKITATAFNEKEKFTLMAQAPRTVLGKRDEKGNILLFSENEKTKDLTKDQTPPGSFTPPLPGNTETKAQQTPPAPKPTGFIPPTPPANTDQKKETRPKYSWEQ